MNTPSFTPLHALRDLQQYATAETLTPALHRLCRHFGLIEKLVILTAKHEGTKQAICFLRLKLEEQEQALMQALGVGRFGGEIVIVVDLKPTDPSHELHPNLHWRSAHTNRYMAFHTA
jgi:hypothetical protein